MANHEAAEITIRNDDDEQQRQQGAPPDSRRWLTTRSRVSAGVMPINAKHGDEG